MKQMDLKPTKTHEPGATKYSQAAPNTSENSPIMVQAFTPEQTGTSGRLGMTLCPGRNSIGRTGPYRRDLRADLTRLRDEYGTKVLVSTIEEHEYTAQKIRDTFAICKELGIEVLWYPIVDGSIPRNIGKFRKLVREIVKRLRYGDNVVVHCKAGLGRTGTLAACVLTRLGYEAEAAIKTTRATRSNTIEHRHQEGFIRTFGGKRPTYANGEFVTCLEGITPPPVVWDKDKKDFTTTGAAGVGKAIASAAGKAAKTLPEKADGETYAEWAKRRGFGGAG